jgi:ATP-dependent Clp protease adaptor protein ClpS
VEAWLALFGLSLGVIGALTSARRAMPRQEPPLTIALTVAALEATRRAQGKVSPAHLAHAAVFALERDGGPDLALVREALEAHLDALPTEKVPPDAPLGPAVITAIEAAATAADREARSLSLRDVLARLREDRLVGALLDAADRPPPSRPGGRLGAPYRAPGAGELVAIVLVNDDVSTMEGVLAVLRDAFAKGNAEALHLMLTTHYEGRAVVGRYPQTEAEAVRARAVAHARTMGMPLAIELELGENEASASARRLSLAERVRDFFRAA